MRSTKTKDVFALNTHKSEKKIVHTENNKRNIGLLSKEDLIDLMKEQRSW